MPATDPAAIAITKRRGRRRTTKLPSRLRRALAGDRGGAAGPAARSEWRLMTATHNLLKLYAHTTAPAAA